ncbi:hypothetical protein FSP39_010335 [Pinctada imbricata]|uniref:B box-type domain-containing protein n=1 Tax=Pinctada imbricata TaxID=66713 RepID=A0AA88XZG1_PINIB|nr:hypothetical protein FSP39_010335 [Pinctada imbricata]
MATSEEKQYCDLLTPVVCDECGGQNDVINYCLQCNANICNKCKATHCDIRLHRDHIVLSRTHPEVIKARRSKRIYCPTHTGKEYVSYCTKCKEPCCVECMIVKHDGHKFSDLEKIISQAEIEVDTLVNDMETNIIPLSEDIISKLEGHMSLYKRSLDDLKESAKKKKLHYIEEIDKRYGTFIAEVDMRSTKHQEIIERKKQEMMEILQEIQSATIKGKKAAVDASILQVKEELEEVLSTIPRHIACPGILYFCPSNFQLPTVNDIIGTYTNDSKKVFLNEQHKVLKTIEGYHASAIISTHDGEMWIYNQNESEICIYDENFALKTKIHVAFHCSDMALHGEDGVIIADNFDCRISLISSSNSITDLLETEDRCSCLCLNNKQDIVVVENRECLAMDDDYNEKDNYWKIVVYSFDDFSVQQIVEDDMMFFHGENASQYIKQTVSGEYVVAIENRIEYLSKEFDVIWTYEFEPMYQNTSTLIGGLYCDTENNILVGDRHRNEIVMLNIDGQLVRTVLTKEDGICGLLSMDVDSKGRLWIGQEDNVLIATYST